MPGIERIKNKIKNPSHLVISLNVIYVNEIKVHRKILWVYEIQLRAGLKRIHDIKLKSLINIILIKFQ